MKNCGTCKYFRPYNDYEYKEGDNDNVGFCEKEQHITQYREIPKIKQNNLMVSASEWGDCSTVLVGINFGCIHWDGLKFGDIYSEKHIKEHGKRFLDIVKSSAIINK